MKLPFTLKTLADWGGEHIVRAAQQLVEKGLVLDATWDDPHIRGAVLWNNRRLDTTGRVLPGGILDSDCPCYTNRERGLICDHIIAVALVLVKRATDPLREAKYREEMRRASRLASVDETAYIRRVPTSTPGAVPAELALRLAADWQGQWRAGSVAVDCGLTFRDATVPLGEAPRDVPFTFSKDDESLLFVLEDICEGPAESVISMRQADLLNVVRLRAGHAIPVREGNPIRVNATRVSTFLRLDIDGETGELLLYPHTEIPYMAPGRFPFYLVSGRDGWAYGADNLWPLESVLPIPYHPVYEDTIVIGRPDVMRFLRQELPALAEHVRIESDLSVDLFSVEPAEPEFELDIQGSPASLAVTLIAHYGDISLVAGKPDANENFAIPDDSDLMRYGVRNLPLERDALALLARTGLQGEVGDALNHIVGSRDVLNFLGSTVPLLKRHGWRVELGGQISPHMESLTFATPVVHIDTAGGSTGDGWFDVAFDFDDIGGSSVSQNDIQRAIRMGDSFLKKGDQTVLIDSEAVNAMMDVFSDCGSRDGGVAGHFQLPSIYTPYVKSSLDALDGVDIEAPRTWIDKAAQQNRSLRIEPVLPPPHLRDVLRPYQREGVNWLRFLERNGFCGILADEMGLGKTLQALTWLQIEREHDDALGKPSLVVCPTSLVHNWEAEARTFAPDLGVLCMSGASRHENWERLEEIDLVVTSYALLRRDQDRYADIEFATVILDEAQHIKNRSTQNAVAAKKLTAIHKLVLTGTPLENSVSDLWSIMDFLMPDYMGGHDAFRRDYERPIARGGPEAEDAQRKLRRKLQPFLLRRLKADVAADLPAKIERVATCALTPDQKAVYSELLASTQRKMSALVAEKGFQRARMEILTMLLRLRQASCHLDLLKLPQLDATNPSAKLDMFFELIDEAVDGGHRVLVFSQFVTMLKILRDELEQRGLAYCYLDGSTTDRGTVVKTFNTDHSVPLFLISLKAGGTGLNLTGADMVIHFDPWWNPAVEDQATDRAHRIGQNRTVYSVKLIAEGTVEEKVLEMQQRKRDIIDATVESDGAVMERLTWDDVAGLVNL